MPVGSVAAILELLFALVRHVPGLRRLVLYPAFRFRVGDAYQIMDAPVGGHDQSRVIAPCTVENVGTGVAENCYLQLISITPLTHPRFGHQVGAVPLQWMDQTVETVEYRHIQPGGMQTFCMARRRKPIMEPDTRPKGGYGWSMDLATWTEDHHPLIFQEGEGLFEVRVRVVGDDFTSRPFTYWVDLDADGGIGQGDLVCCVPPGFRRRAWERIKNPLGIKGRTVNATVR